MRVLHLIGGKEGGGSKSHLLALMEQFNKDEVFLCVFDHGEIPSEAEALGVKVFYLEQHSRYDLTVLNRLKKIMKAEHIDILHTHGARANLYGWLLKKGFTFTWVTTVHSDPQLDFMGRGPMGWLFTQTNLKVLKSADHLFAISKRSQELLLQLGIEAKRITLIYNGVSFYDELHEGVTRRDLGLAESDFVCVTVGRLHPIKGHHYLLTALRQVIQAHPDHRVVLLIIGDGPEQQNLEAWAKHLDVEDHVMFLGRKSDVQPFYSLADVKVLPSLSEGFPLVILEAAKSKTPVIATDVGGVRELIPDQRYGWVVAPRNDGALAEAITEAMNQKDGGALEMIGENLFQNASNHYSLNGLVGKIQDTYLKLAPEKTVKTRRTGG